MERLTVKHYLGSDYYMKCSEDCNVDLDCIDCPAFEKLVDRLAAYEDTGLEPEGVDRSQKVLEMFAEATKGVPMNRLRELAQADREGHLVVLPCKVGDTVYYVAKTKHGFRYVNCHPFGVDDFTWFNANFGKTVFLTREEAEKALEARKGAEHERD